MASVLSYRPNLEVPDVREAALGLVRAESPGVNSTTAGYLGVTDVDGLHAECRRRGIPITTPLTDQPWGLRDFVIEIPGGHRLAIGQRIAG